MTLAEALAAVSKAFADAGVTDSQRDARFLLQGLLNLDALVWLKTPERRLGADAGAVAAAVARRLLGEPVSRIIGERYFYGRPFRVTPDVLDPRADTETLIEAVLETLSAKGLRGAALTIADIGTGSGAIIATLLSELPNARGIASDVSAAALEVAAENAARLGVGERIAFQHTSCLEGVVGANEGDRRGIDVVVSNPPYIPGGEIAGLEVGVREFDPRLALDGGGDGLEVYREILININALEPPPLVFLEVGDGQAADVQEIFSAGGWAALGLWHDLGAKARVVAFEIHC